MQLQYIKSLLQAATIYTEFSGVMPSTNLQAMERLLGYFYQAGFFPSKPAWASTIEVGTTLFSSMKYPQNMAYGICVLWHRLGFLRRKSPTYYKLNDDGFQLAQAYYEPTENAWNKQYRSLVLERLLYLEGVNVLVSFLYDEPGKTKKEIVNALGGEMKHHSGVLAPLGIMRWRRKYQPVSKPFNEAITPMLLGILEELGVVKREGKRYSLTSLMETWIRKMYRFYDKTQDKLVWTAPGEPLILASIAEVIQKSKQLVKIVSPYLDTKAVDLFARTELLKDKNVLLVSRDPNMRTKRALEALKGITEVSIRFLPSRRHLPMQFYKVHPLHAKLALSDSHKAGLITSANFVNTSLLKNYEVGVLTYDQTKNHQLDEIFQTIWESAVEL